jgi:hypothetical protein
LAPEDEKLLDPVQLSAKAKQKEALQPKWLRKPVYATSADLAQKTQLPKRFIILLLFYFIFLL